MIKINNTEYKVANIFMYIVCLSISLFSIYPFINHDIEIALSCLLGGIGILIMFIFTIKWPVTIRLDEEKIVVYRFGKEINRINWQRVTEIYKKDIKNINRLNCFYYFSDGQDRFLNGENGNEHFVVFACPKSKEYLFSKFTDIPIQDMENNK